MQAATISSMLLESKVYEPAGTSLGVFSRQQWFSEAGDREAARRSDVGTHGIAALATGLLARCVGLSVGQRPRHRLKPLAYVENEPTKPGVQFVLGAFKNTLYVKPPWSGVCSVPT